MKNILMNRITLIAAVGGMILALLLGVFSGVDFVSIMIRMIIAGIVLGGAALGIQIVFPKLIGEEAMKVLFPNWGGGDEQSAGDTSTSSRVDITDDSEMSADELYSGGGEQREQRSYGGDSADSTDESGYSGETASPAAPSSNQQFRELDFESEAPKVYPKEEDMGHVNHHDEGEDSGGGDYVTDEFNRLKERAKEGPVKESSDFVESGSSDSVFKVKNTRITADPKIIAKAIRTVMNRD